MPANTWPKERDEKLKLLYAVTPHFSASEIAAELGDGLSRNAIIGRIHRLGLPLRGQGKKRPQPKRPKPTRTHKLRVVRANSNSTQLRVYEASEIELAPLRCAEIEPRNLSLVDLDPCDCRYPVTDTTPFLFCGHPKTDASSYCRAHSALIRTKPRSLSDATSLSLARKVRARNYRRALLEAAE